MMVELKPEQERRIEELMRSGRFHSLDELLDQALEKVSTGEPSTTQEEQAPRKKRGRPHPGTSEGAYVGGLRIDATITSHSRARLCSSSVERGCAG
jgi:Arc/MetJ-type ribon-helix-helix transcriptional regulator